MKKRILQKLTFVLLLLMNVYSVNAQSPTWMWAKSDDRAGEEYANKVVSDSQGNIYVTGTFSSDTINIGGNLVTNGADDIFLAKYDSLGNVLWSLSVGGNMGDVGFSCALDAFGNVVLAGIFNSDSISFGNTTLYNPTPGTAEIFIAKFTNAGNFIWAKQAGGNDTDEARAVCTDSNGNIFVTGGYRSATATFGSIQLTLNGTGDVFTAKYDSSGTAVWVKGSVGSNFQEGNSIGLDAAGNVYITGMFYSATLGFDAVTLNNNGSGDLFVVSYDQNGNVNWAKGFGGLLFEESKGLITDNTGHIYITGAFKSTSLNFTTASLNNSGPSNSADVFVAKLDNSGTVIWANSTSDAGNDYSQAITLDALGNPVITGTFSGASIAFNAASLTGAGAEDIFVAGLNPANGNFLWAFSNGNTGVDGAYSITTDLNGHLIYCGSFTSATLDFNPVQLLNSYSTNNFFIAKTNLLPLSANDRNSKQTVISVAPNPFQQSTVFSVAGNKTGLQSELQIFDLTGRLIQRMEFEGTRLLYHRGNLSEGTYFYRINQQGETLQSGKLLIAD